MNDRQIYSLMKKSCQKKKGKLSIQDRPIKWKCPFWASVAPISVVLSKYLFASPKGSQKFSPSLPLPMYLSKLHAPIMVKPYLPHPHAAVSFEPLGLLLWLSRFWFSCSMKVDRNAPDNVLLTVLDVCRQIVHQNYDNCKVCNNPVKVKSTIVWLVTRWCLIRGLSSWPLSVC